MSINNLIPGKSATNRQNVNNPEKSSRLTQSYRHKTADSWRLFLFVVTVFVSCTTISPVSSAQETVPSFNAIENVRPVWQFFAHGVDYFNGKTISPRLEFWALRVDINAPGIEIFVQSGAENNNSNISLSTKVSSFVRDNNLIAGMNAVPFDIISSRERQPIRNMGIVISDGVLLSPVNQYYDALIFFRNESNNQRRAAIVSQSSITSTVNIENAVGGFHHILIGGQPAQRTLNNAGRHPRSAAGVSSDGRYLYMLVIDGRRAGSIGSTERETALLLRSLGSWDGLNFDGGGSSALAMRFPDDRIRVVNTPVHNSIPGVERAVAGCFGIYIVD